MGFNRCNLPKLEDLQSEYNKIGLENFIKRFRKYDAITGPSESFRFLEEKQKEYETHINNITNNTNNNKL